MPRGDRTGPRGEGPRTGRGAGYCSGSGVPGFANTNFGSFGRGIRRGTGFGRGFGWRAQPAELNQEQEVKITEDELAELEAEKKAIEQELKRLKSK